MEAVQAVQRCFDPVLGVADPVLGAAAFESLLRLMMAKQTEKWLDAQWLF